MRDAIYLNHAGTSWPKPPAVHRAVAEALAAPPERHAELLDAAHRDVCRHLDLPAPGRLLFTSGCTGALALALADLPWEPGDAIVTSALEHHALWRPVDALVRRRGVEHRVAPRTPDAPVDLEAVEAHLRRGRVRWVAVSAASNVTGECLPVADLVALARAHGARVLLDAAQTLGVVPLDVAALGVDVLAFAGHKGAQGPQGVGGLWAAPDVDFDSPAAACAISAAPARGPRPGAAAAGPAPSAAPGRAGFPGYCDAGSANLAGARGLAAGLAWIAERGPDAAAGARGLRAELRDALVGSPRVRVLGGAGAHTATLSLVPGGIAPAQAETRLREHGLWVRAGSHCAPRALEALGHPEGTLRVSFGPTHGRADLEQLLAALASLPAA